MKRATITLTIAILLAMPLFAHLQEQVRKFYPIEVKPEIQFIRYDTIPTPEWNLAVEPIFLMTTYYDYMPGSYCGYPLRLQDEDNGDGLYGIFHARPNPTGNRGLYWFYVYPDDITIVGLEHIWGDNWAGYGSIDMLSLIDSGDPVVVWHEDYDGDTYYETPVTYDDFDTYGEPGHWQPPYPIDNPNAPYDEYIWPYVYIGHSPLGDDYARIYILRSNSTSNSSGHPCKNVEIKYKDVQSPSEVNTAGWEDLVEPPMFTDWREYDICPFQAFNVDPQVPGRIAFAGYAAYLTPEVVPTPPPVEEGFFVYESLDYGENWTLYDFGMPPAIENLLGFEDNQGNVLDSIEVGCMGWHNTTIFDGDGNLHYCYTGCYGFTGQDGYFYYFDYFIPACEFVWFGGDDVGWRNVYPEVPWEVVSGDTLIHWSCAVSTNDPDLIFHENTQKQAVNLENGWMIQVWSDGRFIFGYPQPPYEPCICISVSLSDMST